VGISYQGFSVALSADGNTALIGGGYGGWPGLPTHSNPGAAWVWTRSGGAWAQQGPRLFASDAAGIAAQGSSVALSADGNTAVVGGNNDNNGTGAAWVWTRSGGVWTQQGPKLASAARGGQGTSVSISADGNTVLVGAPLDTPTETRGYVVGATWVWTRSGGVWAPGPKLVGSGFAIGAGQGLSVALSADGGTALAGGFLEDGAWVWTRNGDVWTQQGNKLVGSGVVGFFAGQGQSVSLSADGNAALVGGPLDDNEMGATWVWTRSGGVWTQRGAKLVGSGAVSNATQGGAVSLAASGRTALVGGPADAREQGAAWAFTGFTVGDFDGDGRSDLTVFRPSTGIWYSLLSGGSATATQWGVSTDMDVSADFDGDGKSDVAVWRPSTGTWYIIYSSDGTVHTANWGVAGDVPLAGDVDGDGKADLVIWRPSDGTWYVRESTGVTRAINWGLGGDQPLLADFDADGKADFVIFRPSTGEWFIAFAAGGTSAFPWGVPGDIPVSGDWDGDGRADAAVFRPSTGQWFISLSTGGTIVLKWGTAGDLPIAADVDGDGRSDFTVWRPSNGVWYTQFATGGTIAVPWGTSGDQPVGRSPGS
jgi:hypothetical protein